MGRRHAFEDEGRCGEGLERESEQDDGLVREVKTGQRELLQ